MTDEDDREPCPSHALRNHDLDYLPNLRVGEELFTTRFESGCSMMKCNGYCCREGVVIDADHKVRLLDHAALVQKYMDETQTKDTSRWFEPEEDVDPDFPSGRSSGTLKHNDACVFLDKNKRCVLQLAEAEVPNLKPFYCRTYPIVIIDSRLTYDDEHSPSETHCCGPVKDGPLDVFDVCTYELEFTLGAKAKGLVELKRLARKAGGKPREEAGSAPERADAPDAPGE
jgi:Fe-S-cluster containining protein